MLQRLLCILILFYLSACTGPSPRSEPITPTQSSAQSASISLPASSPTHVAATTTAPPKLATRIISPTRTLLPSRTPTITHTPQPSPTFDTLRQTPPTLMLHRSSADFDSVAFLKGFVQILKENEIQVVTYAEISRQPDITAAESGRLIIITIDDISLQAKIDPSIQEMIAILREAGYPAVLGIVTEGKLADEETSAKLKELADEGFELAMHTESHTDLHLLEQTSPYGARLEIRTCAEKIFQATGVTPITLVLPYGNMVQDLKILYRENVVWVVGIVGGEKYRTTNHVYYVGRESPSGDPARTFDIMLDRFGGG